MLQILLVGLTVCFVRVHGVGIPLPIGEAQINDASAHDSMNTLFKSQIQAHPIVMFTKSGCSLSRKARELMNDNYPNVDYHYYEYDTQPLGDYFMYPSILTSGTLKTPQIYMCDRFIGGTSSLRAIHDNNQLLSTVQSCTKRK